MLLGSPGAQRIQTRSG